MKKTVQIEIIALCTLLGYLTANISGAIAGATLSIAATILAPLGLAPIVGQLVYIKLMNSLYSWVTEKIGIKLAFTYKVALAYGLILTIIYSIALIIAVLASEEHELKHILKDVE